MLQSVLTVGQQVLILFILSGVGFALGKAKMVGEAFSRGCSQLIMYVVSPCMMVVAFQRSFEKEGFHNFCMAFLLAVLIHLLGIAMAQLFFRQKTEKAVALRFSVVHSNCGFMGYPLMTALFGTIGVFYGSAYVVVFTFLSWTYGIYAMTGDRSQLKLRPLLLNPGVISTILAMALFLLQITLPETLMIPITYLADLNTPLPMVVVGYQLSHADFRAALQGIGSWVSLLLRLVALPLLSLGICLALGLDSRLTVITVIAASAPPAALMSMFSAKFGLDTALASSLVSVQTAFSALTMPLLVSLANYLA